MMALNWRSEAKKEAGFPSADQMLYEWINPHTLALGIVDGRKSLYIPPEYTTCAGSALFPGKELAEFCQKYHMPPGLPGMEIPDDTFAALAVTKMFPLSSSWEELKKREGLSAKELMLGADVYFSSLLPAWTLNTPFPSCFLPACIGSMAVIDFQQGKMSTAHVGDTTMGYLRFPIELWERQGRKDIVDILGLIEPTLLSAHQGKTEDRRLEYRVITEHLSGEVRQQALRCSYEGKDNKTVGIMNGRLNPDLIISHTIPLKEVLALYFCTDGIKFGEDPQSIPFSTKIATSN